MARRVDDHEERKRRINLVGEYYLKTGDSTRAISKYFSDNFFKISNYTVHDYIELYKKDNSRLKESIEKLKYENTPDSIKKPEVIKRVLIAAKLLKEGFTIEEISESLKEDYWVIYRDIHVRLQKIDIEIWNEINKILKEHSLNNLTQKGK